jgi:hypothetical protein
MTKLKRVAQDEQGEWMELNNPFGSALCLPVPMPVPMHVPMPMLVSILVPVCLHSPVAVSLLQRKRILCTVAKRTKTLLLSP